jgi:hypothetical protein
MKRIINFVEHTFKVVPKEQRDKLVEQVTMTLKEKVEDLIDQGYSLDEAIDKTVLEFGNVNDYFPKEELESAFAKKIKTITHYRNDLLFSVLGSIIIIGMLIFTNLTYTGDIIWFVLPSLAVLWWPLALLYRYLNHKERDTKNE